MVEKHNKYSIRKLSVGAVSVLSGASFLAVNGKTDVDGNINSSVNTIKQENSGNNISNDVNKETAKENTTNIVDNSKIVENTSDANTISKHDNTPQSNSQTKALANNIASAKK